MGFEIRHDLCNDTKKQLVAEDPLPPMQWAVLEHPTPPTFLDGCNATDSTAGGSKWRGGGQRGRGPLQILKYYLWPSKDQILAVCL